MVYYVGKSVNMVNYAAGTNYVCICLTVRCVGVPGEARRGGFHQLLMFAAGARYTQPYSPSHISFETIIVPNSRSTELFLELGDTFATDIIAVSRRAN